MHLHGPLYSKKEGDLYSCNYCKCRSLNNLISGGPRSKYYVGIDRSKNVLMEDITIFPYNIEHHYDDNITIVAKYVKNEKAPAKIELIEIARFDLKKDIPMDIKELDKKIKSWSTFL
jgi:hypothetical protein